MKKGYILKRLIRSLLSVLLIMLVVFVMVFTLISRETIFNQDDYYKKLSSKPIEKMDYRYATWEKLGYMDYVTINDYCSEKYGYEAGSDEMISAIKPTSAITKEFLDFYTAQGYSIDQFKDERYLVYKDIPIVKHLASWFASIVVIDTTNYIQDPDNPNLERSISFGKTPTGGLAIIGSGTYHKYLLYTDSRFPFIHQNFITFNFGKSYPTYQGIEVLDVLFQAQGDEVKREVTFETGLKSSSAINFGSLTYKEKLDKIDQQKFVDHYANYTTFKNQSSMIGTSFIMGLFAMILAYAIGLPAGVSMARNKDKLVDKMGMVYIIFIIAVPSLAYIYLFRYIGSNVFGLPSLFTTKGPEDITSWILPIISLALPSISSLMLWTRRYVVDQMNSDYVKFAKAKGLNEKEIFNKHIFKNAIIPIAQGIPSSLAGCITGAIITESIYSVGGMGKMLPNSINKYNNIMVVALTFIFASVSIISVLLGDIVLIKIDPRISLSEKEGRA